MLFRSLDLLLCGIVYGFDGLACYNGMALGYLLPWPERMIPLSNYMMMVVLLCFLGVLSLGAITMCISSHCKTTFHAVSATAICWGAPILIQLFSGFSGIGKLLTAAPVFMVISEAFDDCYDFWLMPAGIAVLVMLFCVCRVRWRYRILINACQ